MPLGRYFTFMGGALLALLFFADWYMPKLSAEPHRAGIDKSTIRIHSLHKWPEAVAIDTRLPTITPPVVAAEAPAGRTARDALALLPPPAPAAAPTRVSEAKAGPAKRRSRSAHAASRRVAGYRTAVSADISAADW